MSATSAWATKWSAPLVASRRVAAPVAPDRGQLAVVNARPIHQRHTDPQAFQTLGQGRLPIGGRRVRSHTSTRAAH